MEFRFLMSGAAPHRHGAAKQKHGSIDDDGDPSWPVSACGHSAGAARFSLPIDAAACSQRRDL